MARNRKRAKDRRAQRASGPGARPGVADARAERADGDARTNGQGDALDAAAAELDQREAALDADAAAAHAEAAPNGGAGEPGPAGDADLIEDGDEELAEADPVAEAKEDLEEESEIEHGETPDALEHAAPDAEIAESRIALGALEASTPEEDEPDEDDVDDETDSEADADHEGSIELSPAPARRSPSRGSGGAPAATPRRRRRPEADDSAATDKEVAVQRPSLPTRLVHFVQGSWKELQRVQWPDRRQVMQATGVVLGFVIVAGAFLGVSDWLAGKLINWIIG